MNMILTLMFCNTIILKAVFSSKYLKCKENYSKVRQSFVIILNTMFYAYVSYEIYACIYMKLQNNH